MQSAILTKYEVLKTIEWECTFRTPPLFRDVIILIAKERFSGISFELYAWLLSNAPRCQDYIHELIREGEVVNEKNYLRRYLL